MSIYPNTFYRVSVKAFIANEQGHVLVVKENQDTWSLPGGGLDHGEEPQDGVRRELKEELGVTMVGDVEPFCAKTFYLEHKQAWLLWVVYKVELPRQDFIFGEGVTAAQFIDPKDMANSEDVFEKLVYTIAREA